MRARTSLLLLLLFPSLCVADRGDRYTIKTWGVEDGMPQSSVRCLAQTPDGYLWVGTWNGLARFDGLAFTVFHSANTPALSSSNVMNLFVDSRGTLWIGTDGAGAVRYAHGVFISADSLFGLPAKRVLDITEDPSGRIWFSTDIGFFAYDGTKLLHFDERHGLIKTYANQVIPLPDGSLYLSMVNDAAHVRLRNDSLIIERQFVKGGFIASLDSTGTLWYGLPGTGMMHYRDGREFADTRFRHDDLQEAYLLPNGELWVSAPLRVFIFAHGTVDTLSAVGDVRFDAIRRVFEDREGNIWLGKAATGLIRLRQKQVRMYGKKNAGLDDEIMCGHEDRSGALWIGTWDGGLFRAASGTNPRFEKFPFPVPGPSIQDIKEFRDGSLWISSWARGMFIIRDGRVRPISRGFLRNDMSMCSSAESPDGGVWVGTAHNGVQWFRGAEERAWTTANGLSSNEINSVTVIRNGDVWIATSGGGVDRISGGRVTVIDKARGLSDDFAAAVLEDHQGTLWIGTTRGLNRWKPARPGAPGGDGTLTVLTERHGLHDDAIGQMIEDDDGNLWIGAIHGIYRVSIQDLNDAADGRLSTVRCLALGKEDGMVSEECGAEGDSRAWKTRDGRLWFSTSAGAVSLDPRSVSGNPVPPNVIIEAALVANEPVPFHDEVILPAGQTELEIRYTGINLSAPRSVRFKYHLDGFDTEWREAGNARSAHFTNLDPGTYTFRVIGSNQAGVWNTKGASLNITVLPPYWATWWFRGVIILFFLSVGPIIYYRRVTSLKKAQALQREFARKLIESQEAERQRIAAELHDSIGQDLLVIKNRLLIGRDVAGRSPDAAAEFQETIDHVSRSLTHVREISRNLRPVQLDQIGLTAALESVVETVADASLTTFDAHFDNVDKLLSKEAEINLFRIVQEALNNILKHAEATNVRIELTRTRSGLALRIEDDGKGIPTGSGTGTPPGLGLTSMNERARMLQAELRIHSGPGRGTRVHLNMPLEDRTSG